MASPRSFLSEDQFQCSICLDVFTEPISTPCGHNFCKVCISRYWDTTDLCQCPMCKHKFFTRPELHVNTFISEMAAQFRRSVQVEALRSPNQSLTESGEVACDVCTGTKLKALKSCMECLTSFCEIHLQPHQRVAGMKRHNLIDPVENLEDRMCKKHDRLLELFCRTDQTCVCQFCTETDHKTHHLVPQEEECGERKAQLGKMEAQVQQMIQERLQKVQKFKNSVELSKRDTEREIADSMQLFTDLVCSIERSQAELIELVEEKQKAAEMRADRLIKELEQEITELKRRRTELKQLSLTEDHLHLLQSSLFLSPPTNTKDWSEISVHSALCVGIMRRTLSQLEETVIKEMEKLCDAEMMRMQRCAVDVTLDPDTANQCLILSEDRKQVRYEQRPQFLIDNPKRFDSLYSVLGKEGFSSGGFYYEVQVKGKIEWVFGVAKESIKRKGSTTESPEGGLWTVYMRGKNKYEACDYTRVPISLREKLQKVGVFVDYEEGQISFYNVEARSHIYSFTGNTFTDKLYPFFNPCNNSEGPNSAPLVICPVNHTD